MKIPTRKNKSADVEAFIARGAEESPEADETAREKRVPITLRMPASLLDKIDRARARLPHKPDRTAWILEAIAARLPAAED